MDVSLLDFNYSGSFWTKDLEGLMMNDMHLFWYIKTQTNNSAIAHEQCFLFIYLFFDSASSGNEHKLSHFFNVTITVSIVFAN